MSKCQSHDLHKLKEFIKLSSYKRVHYRGFVALLHQEMPTTLDQLNTYFHFGEQFRIRYRT